MVINYCPFSHQVLSLDARITFGYTLPFVMLTLVTICDIWKGIFVADASYRFTLAAIAVVALGCTGRPITDIIKPMYST